MQTAKKADPKGQTGRSKIAQRQGDDPENRAAQTFTHRGMLGVTANSNTRGNALTFIVWRWVRGGHGRIKHFSLFGEKITKNRQEVETELGPQVGNPE